jgi:saccharopine dehydrogenase-like NADP-dependent oxidoreductase
MKKIIVLGTGLVGGAIAKDLAGKYEVFAADKNPKALDAFKNIPNIRISELDILNENVLKDFIKDSDLVVSAVPGFIGFRVLKSIIEAGKNVVDISFFPEDAFELDELAQKNGVTAIVDCGVAPGLPNIIAGFHYHRMNIESLEFQVGGLPFERSLPYQYKAPFSPVDVLEEYTRPARYVEKGKIVTKPALSEPELIYFDGIGTLEGFLTDGLRSLIKTLNIPNMKEKTLRYPGHIKNIQLLIDTGLLDSNSINFKGVEIKPIEFTSKLLFDKWKLLPEDKEFTIMQIKISGVEDEKKVCYKFHLYDKYHDASKISSMARTTGYTATAAANMLIQGLFTDTGIIPPEFIGKSQACYDFIIDYLKKREVYLYESKTFIEEE